MLVRAPMVQHCTAETQLGPGLWRWNGTVRCPMQRMRWCASSPIATERTWPNPVTLLETDVFVSLVALLLLLLSLPARIEIGPPLGCALLLLLKAPAGDGAMVAAAQHLRHDHAAEIGGAGVVGVLQ